MQNKCDALQAYIEEKAKWILLDTKITAKKLGVEPEDILASLEELVRDGRIETHIISGSTYSIKLK